MHTFKKRIVICFIISFIFLLLYIPSAVMAAKVSDGSSIGRISLENQTIDEAKETVTEAIHTWQNGAPLIAQNEYETIEIPRSVFQFDVESSMNQLEDKMARNWSNFFRKPQNIQQRLLVEIPDEQLEALRLPERIDIEQTLEKAVIQARNLSEDTISLTYVEGVDREQENIAAVTLDMPDMSASMVRLIAQEINGRVWESDQIVSFLDETASINGTENAAAELSFVASGVYQLALQSNMEIIERHAQNHIAGYTEAGLDAAIHPGENLDLQLYNPGDYAYTLQAEAADNTLQLSLQAVDSDRDYEYAIENRTEIAPRKVYRYNRDLAAGEENIVQYGQSGIKVDVYRISKDTNNAVSSKDLIKQDFYPPAPEIIEVAVSDPEEEMEAEEAEEPPGTADHSPLMDEIFSGLMQAESLCEEGDEVCMAELESFEQGQGDRFNSLLLLYLLLEMGEEDGDRNPDDSLQFFEEEIIEDGALDEEINAEANQQGEASDADFPEEQLEGNIEKETLEEEAADKSETDEMEKQPESDTEAEADCTAK